MEPLDDLGYFGRLDSGQMLARIQEFPEQVQIAWDDAAKFAWPAAPQGLQNLVVAGMGASAIGGELLADLAADSCPVPINVQRNYGLPHYVGRNSLVIASSYSGNTEETLSATHEALDRGAHVIAFTSGGALQQLATEKGFPCYQIRYEASPRAALAHSFLPFVRMMQAMGLIANQDEAVRDAVTTLQGMQAKIGPKARTSGNQAKQIAHHCHAQLTLIYGVGFMGSVAHRWKMQLNENAKSWALYETLPEMDHNALLGYEQPDELADSTYCALLQSSFNEPRNLARVDVTREILSQAGIRNEVVEGEGATVLSHMLSLIHLGDYVSFYLAALYGIDPTPVKAVDLLKERLHEAAQTR